MSEGAAQDFFAAARPHRGIITACFIAASLLQVLDATIANVALPHMQGALSASTDQISWVLTSYLIASAIVMPAVGWLSGRFGRRRIALISVAGFTLGSMLCGTAQTIEQMVIFRLIQGVFGAGLVPLSQAVILDIYTPAERGRAMTIWTVGIMVGPIMGPTLGAWLTDTYSWHWVFYVNVPVGALAFAGTWLFLPSMALDRTRKFDWVGFLSLALAIACLQLVLDRGQTKGWFDSFEIACEATLCVVGFYLFIVQTLSAEHPFVSRQLLGDRNFVSSMAMAFMLGLALNSTSALLPPYFQGLGGYPVLLSGLAMAPRGVGTLIGSLAISRLLNVADPRYLIGCGLLMIGGTSWEMSHWTPDVSLAMQVPMMLIQGAAMTTVFTPMQIVAFSNVPSALRTEASGLISLVRNFGGSIGVAMLETLLARNTQVTHQDLARFATPFNRALQSGAAAKYWDLKTAPGLTQLDALVNYHAQIVAYSDDFFTICLMVIPASVAVLLMRRPGRGTADDAEVHGVLE